MMMEDGVVGVLDCGMAGRIDEQLRGEVEGMLLAAVNKDTDELLEIVLRVGSVPLEIQREALRSGLDDFLGDYVGQRSSGNGNPHRRPIHRFLRTLEQGGPARDRRCFRFWLPGVFPIRLFGIPTRFRHPQVGQYRRPQ